MEYEKLIQEAQQARSNAYAPYSHFMVGAALLGYSGRIYTGCNVENAAFSPTNCAERTAFFKAVSEGERRFRAIAIVGHKQGTISVQDGYCMPCGVCRQVMMEFCDDESFEVIVVNGRGRYKVYTLRSLLPEGFGPAALQEPKEDANENV
ncbi:MAG: cytidine deaminase [Lachnospiraceae bacterium]